MTQQPSAQARLTLQDAFERFAATVTPDDKREFTNTTLNDVRDEAIKIEQQLRARRTQRYMIRLDPFLRGVEHYSKVVEVLCNGTPYLSWIWAPVKLMLMIAVDSLSAFEKLIEAYGKIADMLPRFDRLGTALNHDHNFQALLALVYADILEVHRRAYKFVRRKSWSIFFGSMWAGFESRFGAILTRLAYHSELIDKEAIAVDISDAVTRNKEEIDRWEQQEHEWQALKVRTVLSWLATDDPTLEDTLDRHMRDCLPRSCDWFIQHQKTQLWLKDGVENAVLWLCGKPGAGKSVICSSLVQHAQANDVNVFFYFCSYLTNSTESSSRLLRSLAAQIIQKYQDLAVYVHDIYFKSYPTPSRKALLRLLPELLQGLGSVRFVVDGIDEWDAREQKEFLTDIMQMLSTDPSFCICKILLASRDTLEISRSLRKNKATVSISLSDSDEGLAIDRSIRDFINEKLSKVPDHFSELDPDAAVLQQVKRVLLDKSNGMFLWVRLVLDSLEVVYSLEELRNIVDDLPSDLEALYGRILSHLYNARGPHNYGGVPRIMSWICFARRPLHKQELLQGLAIPPTDLKVNTQSVPLAQILDHCKPFIEERSDSTVVLVHFSVKEFFLKSKVPQVIPPIQAQLDISSACAATLMRGLDLLHTEAAPSHNLVRIAGGGYRLLPYALEFWIEHCLLYALIGGPLDLDELLPRRLTHLRNKHDQLSQRPCPGEIRDPGQPESFESQLADQLKVLAHIPIHDLMIGVLHARWSASQQLCENGEDAEAFTTQNDRTLFSKLATKFNSAVIHLLLQDKVEGVPQATLEAFQKSYASTAFRCRFPYCPRSSAGFASQQLRTQHEVGHFHRVYCKVESCQWSRIGFEKKSRLDSHTRKHHDEKSAFSIPPKVRRAPEDGEGSKRKSQEPLRQSLLLSPSPTLPPRFTHGPTESSVEAPPQPLSTLNSTSQSQEEGLHDPDDQVDDQEHIASMLERSKNSDFRKRPMYMEVRNKMEVLSAVDSKPAGTIDMEREQKRHEDWMRRGKKLFGKANAPLHILHVVLKQVDECNRSCLNLSDQPRTPAEPMSREQTPAEDENVEGAGSSSELFCICRRREAGMMIECEFCHEWYHGKCLKIPRGKIKEDDAYTCPICDYRVKIPRDLARPRLEDLQMWQKEIPNLPFQAEEKETLDSIIDLATKFREHIAQYTDPLTSSPNELTTKRFYLRKLEGAGILLSNETNFFRQELHKWAPVAPNPPPVLQVSLSTRRPRPTKQQKLMYQLGITNPDDLPSHLRTKTNRSKQRSSLDPTKPQSPQPAPEPSHTPSHSPPHTPSHTPSYTRSYTPPGEPPGERRSLGDQAYFNSTPTYKSHMGSFQALR